MVHIIVIQWSLPFNINAEHLNREANVYPQTPPTHITITLYHIHFHKSHTYETIYLQSFFKFHLFR